MIRLAGTGDARAMADIYAPIVSGTAISFELVPPTADEMGQRLSANLLHAPWLVCVRDGGVMGFAYASRRRDRAAYRWSVDVSVYVHEDGRRHGIGRGLYTSLFALLRLQGFHAAHAGITLPNAGSVGLHEALGFLPVGVYRSVGYKQGAWHDVGWWQLVLRERVGEPAPPLSLADIQGGPAWPEALAAGVPCLRWPSAGRVAP